MITKPQRRYVEEHVVRDENVITAKGGAIVDFSFAICEYLDIYSGRNDEKERLYREIMNR